MRRKENLKLLLFIDIILLVTLISYKSYLIFFESDFQSSNINSINQLEDVYDKEISFAVLGNIENSIDVFDKKIVDKLNQDESLDFIISTGNSVMDGAEDKYRILNESLKKIKVPTIVGIGEKEISEGGDVRFYKHYGPFYFSFSLDNAYFIFLDTTGKTSIAWQKEWLIKELKNAEGIKHIFVFMNKPPYEIENNNWLDKDELYINDREYSGFLINTFSEYRVDGVFATGPQIYDHRSIKGVNYYLSGGGGGGLLLNKENSYYHYINVDIQPDKISYTVVKQEIPSKYGIIRAVENIWVYIHSLFYINFINFSLIIGVLFLFGIIIYLKASKEIDYYRSFTDIGEVTNKEPLKIAMFTNNYSPFIGGVPISIKRLSKGLAKRGHSVYIFAPEYPEQVFNKEDNIIRCKLLTYYKAKEFNFAIANVFSSNIEEDFISWDFDIVHVHHPFWMGKKGLKLGIKHGIPVVLTYHTRLEKYEHFLPFGKLIFKNIISHYMIRRFSQRCDTIFAPTQTAMEYLQNVGVSKHKIVLPTGIDFDSYSDVDSDELSYIQESYRPHDGILLCSVSRLSKEKNIYFLLKAIKYIQENSNIPFKMIIIGDGPEKDNILSFIKEEGLEDVVLLLGSISPTQVSKYYMASDIFVFSSQSETQGMVLLEAMAGRCPVVALRSSGIEDLIHEGYNGLKSADDIKEWAEKVLYLMESPKVLKEMSDNAYSFSQKFSIDEMAEKAEAAYYRAISSRKGSMQNEADNQLEEISEH